ncbi:hypothetical protein KC352_g59 [Hortaea werneckii]|nr:hypothetical protein KC352_g59 [Hortaea werneckii]
MSRNNYRGEEARTRAARGTPEGARRCTGVLEASPSISTQIVASHRIEQMKKVDEQVLINNIKEYSAEVKELRRAQRLQRHNNVALIHHTSRTCGLEQGATRFFQQAQDPTATSNPDDDFEGAIQWFFGKVTRVVVCLYRSMNVKFRYEAKAEESLFLDMQSHDVEAYIIRRLRAQPYVDPQRTDRHDESGYHWRRRP